VFSHFVGGSRPSRLSPAAAQVARVVGASVAASGGSLAVGCSLGADAAAVLGFLSAGGAPSSVQVFAVGAPDGSGFSSPEATLWCRVAASRGCVVSWLAGGSLAVPPAGRLVGRAAAAVRSASASAAFVVSSAVCPGSLAAAAVAVGRGLPVVFFVVGFAPAALPLPPGCAGVWRAVSAPCRLPPGCLLRAFAPAQGSFL